MNSTSLDIKVSETLANKSLIITTILVRTAPQQAQIAHLCSQEVYHIYISNSCPKT